MFSIGEFSRIVGLTVKALRHYDQQGILPPARVDASSGYRYYDDASVESARVIRQLRDLGFPLAEIRSIIERPDDETGIREHLLRQRDRLAEEMRVHRKMVAAIDQIIHVEEEESSRTMNANQQATFEIEEKDLPALRVAAVRMHGYYRDCGKGFARIGRALGRFIRGAPMMLHHNNEYRDGDADFEPCMPVRDGASTRGDIEVKELPAGRAVTLTHRGPYEELGRSYERVVQHIQAQGYEVVMPTREVYLKGPGMIFRGNPKKYLTEIQFLVVTPSS